MLLTLPEGALLYLQEQPMNVPEPLLAIPEPLLAMATAPPGAFS